MPTCPVRLPTRFTPPPDSPAHTRPTAFPPACPQERGHKELGNASRLTHLASGAALIFLGAVYLADNKLQPGQARWETRRLPHHVGAAWGSGVVVGPGGWVWGSQGWFLSEFVAVSRLTGP